MKYMLVIVWLTGTDGSSAVTGREFETLAECQHSLEHMADDIKPGSHWHDPVGKCVVNEAIPFGRLVEKAFPDQGTGK